MNSTEKILSTNGEPLLSAKEVALMLDCAPDYVSKLCREEKLVATRTDNGWLIEKNSVVEFDHARIAAKIERAKELSLERKFESARHNKQTKVFSAEEPKKSTAEFLASHRAFAFAVSGLLGVLVFAGSFMLSHASIWDEGTSRSPLAAALGQIDSPFFGARPAQIVIPDFGSGSSTSTFFSNLFTSIFNSTSAPTANTFTTQPQTTVQVIPTQVRTSGTSTTVVQNSTYPVIERTVERIITQGGISQKIFDTAFSELTNALTAKIYQLSSQQNNSFTSNYAPSQRIDNLQNVTITNGRVSGLSGLTDGDIPNDITASNYLPLTGGTLSALTIGTLNGPLQANEGIISATSSVGTIYGGTGLTSYTTGDILYASAPNTLSTLGIGANGRVLKVSGGVPVWGVDNSGGGGGGSGAWATTTDSLAVYPSDISQVVLVGNDATTTLGNIFEVSGNALFRNGVTTYGTSVARSFTATSTTASIFPYASSTAITISGTASTSNLIVSNNLTLAQSFTGFLKTTAGVVSTALVDLAANVTGILPVSNGGTGVAAIESNTVLLGNGTGAISTTTRGNLTGTGITVGNGTNAVLGSGTTLTLDTSGNWGGTFDGQEGSYFLANSFSTTSASYFLSQNTGAAFSTTSVDYWKTQNNFFSTTSSAYWLTTKTTDDLTQGSTNKYYSDTLVNTYIHASTTIPKTYTANIFSALQQFAAGASTTQLSSGLAYFGTTATSSFASNGALTLAQALTVANGGTGSTTLTGILKGNGTGQVQTAVGGTDYEFPLTFSAPLSRSTNTISITQSGAGANGYLSSADWNIFNNKISSTSLSGGTGISYNSSSGVITNTGVTSLTGTANQITASASTGAITLSLPSLLLLAQASTTQLSSGLAYFGTTATSSFASNGALTLGGTLTLSGSPNGPLQANAGIVSATTSIGVLYGGTGLTTAPSYGQVLLGNASGGYDLVATSSLGITGGGGGGGITAIGPAGQTQTGSTITFATSTTGTDFTITATGNTVTYNLPTASSANTGKLSATDWNIFNNKISSSSLSGSSVISYNSSSGVITTTGGTFGTGNYVFPGNLTATGGQATFGNASTTNISANTAAFGGSGTTTISSTGALNTPSATIGSLSGLLYGNSGVVAAAAVSSPLSFSAGTLSITQSGAGANGYLSSADWNIFNNKISSTSLSGGTGISYNSSSGVITNTGVTSTAGDWTGTFDGQEGTYYLDARNLTNFGAPFYTFFSATTTDALTQGSTNKYYSNTLVNTFIHASTTIAKTYTDNTFTGGNIFGNATTTNATTTSLYISGPIAGAGLTGCSSSVDKLLYNATTGQFSCGTDQTGGGGGGSDINWTFFNGSGLRPATTTNQVVIGGTATTSLAKLQVIGGALIDSATTTNLFSTTASSTNLYTSNFSLGGLTGFLKATAGVVSTALVDLASNVTGTLPVSNGGTGSTTLTGILKGNGTGGVETAVSGTDYLATAVTAIGPAGQTQTGATITFATSTTGSDFTITATGNTVTYNLPTASTANTGKLSATDWNIFNNKISSSSLSGSSVISYNSSSGVITTTGGTFGTGNYVFPASVTAPYASSTALTVSGTTYLNNLLATASSTIGGGTQATGLTINGGATTTGNAYVGGRLGLGVASPNYAVDVAGFINTDQYSGFKQAGNTVLYASTTNNTLSVGSSAAAVWMSASSTPWYSIAIGQGALGTTPTAGSAQNNIAIGNNSLSNLTLGANNVALGGSALFSNTVGYENFALGTSALYNNTEGNYNVGIGANTLLANTTGSSNIGIGRLSLQYNTVGQGNIGLGYASLNVATSSDYNTAIGYFAGAAISGATGQVGGNNTLIGYLAGSNITTGAFNTILGSFTGSSITTGSNNILLGRDVRSGLDVAASNQLNIGNLIFGTNLGSANTLSSGNVGIGTSSPFATFSVNGSGFFSGNVTATNIIATGTLAVSGNTTLANATSTNLFGNTLTSNTAAFGGSGTTTISSTGALSTPSATIGSLSGLLYGNSGVVAAAAVSSPLSFSAGTLSITQSGAGANGYLSSADWNIFNNKISSTSLSGASVISYNSGTGVITTTGGTFGTGNYVFPASVTAPYASSTALTVSGTTYLNNLLATASSTIGGGTQATGLTISGGATTTGNLIVQGAGTSTFANGIDIASGCFALNGNCLSTGITAIGPAGQTQTGATITFATSTTGSDFTITATGNTVTYNLPTASTANTGKLSATDWNIFNNKISSTSLSGASVIAYNSSTGVITTTGGTFGAGNYVFPGNVTAAAASTSLLSVFNNAYFGGTATSTFDSAGNLSIAGTLGVTGSTTLANATSTNFYSSGALTVGGNVRLSSFGSGCYLLTDGSGNVTCGSVASSGGDTNWSYFNGSGLRLATTSNQVLIGASATTSLAKLEVQNGNVYFQNNLGIGTTSPYLPLSVAGSGVFGNTVTASTIIATSSLGVGTTSPQSKFTVSGGNITHVASGNPTLAATVSTTDFVYNTYVVGNYAYVAENANGLRILDITNPKSPVTVGSYTGISSAFSVVVAGKYAYVGDSSTGLNIIDISNPKNPTLVGTYGSSGRSFTLAISGKYVYAPDILTGKVNIIDVSDPTNPVLAGTYTTNGATGNPYAVAVSGKYLYIGDQGTQRIYIVDVSNPKTPTLMSSYSTNVVTPTGIAVSGQYAYITDNSKGFYALDISNPVSIAAVATYSNTSNYGGLSVAGSYAYISDRTNGALVVLDVSASTTPRLVGSYAVGSTPRALFVSGKYAYLSGYDLGLKVIDINGTETPAANIGSLAAGSVNIADSLNLGGDLFAGGGLSVGISGIYSRGTIAAYVASSTQTNPVVASFMGGNVGIGTTSPFTTLSVAGSAFFTGNVTASNITATGTLAVSGNTTLANATSTNLFGNTLTSNTAAFGGTGTTTISSAGALSTPALTIASLSGLLYGNSGVVAAAAVSAPLSFSAGTLSITQSGTGANGYLSSVDWNVFNNKISSTSLSGASVISYNSGTGAITTTGGTFGAGNYVFPGNLTATGGQAAFANASTTNLSANTTAFGGTGTTTISSTGALTTPSATIGSLNGLLKASSGVVSAAVAGTDYLVNAITGVGPAGQTQTGPTITYATTTTGTDFTITASGNTINFNLPTASNSNRGLLSSADWTTFNSKAGLSANIFTGLQQFTAGASTTQLSVFERAYFGATATSTFTSTGALGIASSTPWGLLSINPNGISGPSFVIGSSTLTSFIVTNGGNVGIGTTSPYSIFSVSQTASVAQFTLAYDTADRTDFRTDATGNLWVVPTGSSGGNVYMTNNNLWVCTGGSITSNACPTGTPTGQGNIIAQNKVGIGTSTPNSLLTVAGTRPSIDLSDTTAGTNLKHWLFTSAGGNLYVGTSTDAYATSTIAALTINSNGFVGIGTTTPTQGLSVAQKLFVGNGAPTTAGTATSTFQGDVLITGKLDVSTIDPVYTIDGTKYATYALAGVGIKEEMSTTVTLTTKNKKTGKYEYVIDFANAPKGSDAWLFYQITTFGEGWKDLVANVTPGFDGAAFYTKDPATNTLRISSDMPGEVSVRLVATRFDTASWPNLRPDQDGGFGGFQLQSK